MKKKAWPFETPINPQDQTILVPEQELRGTFSTTETHTPMPEPPVGLLKNQVEGVADNYVMPESYPQVYVDIHSDDDILASFSCDLASSIQDKVMGLQSYDDLAPTAGLIFPYDNPQDVVYHMGTVKFPIDIVFIGEDDCIKKIYKDIQPGTLGTFGCPGVKNVLEICGGLCDKLGLSHGHKVSFKKSDDLFHHKIENINRSAKSLGLVKNIIAKYSKSSQDRYYHFDNFPLVVFGDNLIKTASKEKTISKLTSLFKVQKDLKVHVFDFDGIIESNPMVRVFKTSEISKDSNAHIKIGGFGVSIDKDVDGNYIEKDVDVSRVLDGSESYSIIASFSKSFSNFLNNKECRKMLSQLNKVASEPNSKIIIATRLYNPRYLREIILSRYNLQFNENIAPEIIKIEKESDFYDIIKVARKRCGNRDIKVYSDRSLVKRAGVPIPESTINLAKDSYKKLEDAHEKLEKSLNNMQKNLDEYNKISADIEAIKGTKGQYHQSVKNNKELFKEILITIRDSIVALNKIKDATTTRKYVDSITKSSKSCADGLEEIFSLADKIEGPEFIPLLQQKTDAYKKLGEDLLESVKGCKDYINRDILGLIILSD